MNKKVKQNYESLALHTGLRLDEDGGALYGEQGGFGLTVYAPNASYPYMLAVSVSAQRTSGPVTKEEAKDFKAECKQAAGLTQNGYKILMSLKNIANQEKLQENLRDALNRLTNFLRAGGFQNCCQTCGKLGATDNCYISGSYLQLCSDCFTSTQQNHTVANTQRSQRSENVVGGIVGALLGTILGVVCIIVISQLGYVAAISGVVMAVCTIKGYELLGGKLTQKGIVICILLMLLMTYIGDRIDWAIVISRELQADFFDAFHAFPILFQDQMIDPVIYWGNLVMLYTFLLVGAVPTILSAMKNRKNQNRVYRLGSHMTEL